MKEHYQKIKNYLTLTIVKHEENQYLLNDGLISLLYIQKAILSYSYIQIPNSMTYATLLSYAARPQILLPKSNIYSYFIISLSILFLLNFFLRVGNKHINLFGILLKSSLLNTLFELAQGELQIPIHILLIILSLFLVSCTDETYNIKINNFKQTKVYCSDYLLTSLNIFVMMANTYSNSIVFIQIIALLINTGSLINVVYYYGNKTFHCNAILFTTHIFTFYFGIIEIFNFDKDLYHLSIILVALTYKVFLRSQEIAYNQAFSVIQKNKIYSTNDAMLFRNQLDFLSDKQISISQSNSEQKIIYSSILIEQNKPFEAFVMLNEIKQQQFSLLRRIKVKLLYNLCVRKINTNIQREQVIFNRIAQATKEIILTDKLNQTIQQQVLEIMLDKIQCQNYLLSNQTILKFQNYLNFVSKVLKTQKKLEKQYEQLPCEKTQNILGFFYSEIMNDYLSAFLLFNVVTLSDEKIANQATYQDVFTNKMIYLLTKYDGNLTIVNPSQEAGNLLQISNEFLIGKNVTELIPPGVSEQHNLIVEEFFRSGKSKFYRLISRNLIYNSENKFMDNFEFAFDISFGKELNFLTFIQPAQNKSMEMILNNQHIITCVSYQLAFELGFVNQTENYIGVDINKIIPKFPDKIEDYHYIENAEVCFDLHDIGQSHQSSTLQPFYTSYYISSKILNGKRLYINIIFEGFRKVNLYNFPLTTTENTQNVSHVLQTNFALNSNDEIVDESSVRMPQELNIDHKIVWQPYFVEEKKQSTHFVSIDQNNFSNDLKFEYTNIKSVRSNDGLLAEQQRSMQPITINIDCYQTQNNKIVKEEDMVSKEENEEVQDQNLNNDAQSQLSTLRGIKKSQFYKKYELVQKLRFLKSNSRNHNLVIFMLSICIVVQLIVQAIQLGQLDKNLKSLASDIDLLQIKNLIYQPFESFIITRWTMINYNAMLTNGQITKQQHTDLFKFPLSNLNMGFDLLEGNFKEVGDRPGIQTFLEETYLIVYTYITTGVGEPYNVTLRNSINILLSYQYDLKMRYVIEGAIVTDSPYVFYSYRNYINMKSLFSQLNEEVLQDTTVQSQSLMSQTQSIYIISFVCLFVIFPLSFHYFLNIQRAVNKFYSLIFNIEPEFIHHEIQRLKYLVDKFNKDSNILFKFQLGLEFKEKSFNIAQAKLHGNKKSNYSLSTFYLQNFFYYFVFTVIIAIITGNATLTYSEAYQYLWKYPSTAKFYKSVSDIGTDVPTMFGQRDILYNISYIAPFLNETTQKYILQEIVDALNRTTKFLSLDQNFENTLISNDFSNYFQNIMKGNLCDYIPDSLKNKSKNLCPIVMESQMQRGLNTILIYVINYISTDMEISHFKNRTSYTYMNLEGAFIVSNIIREVNVRFHADLITQTQLYIDQINMHNIILIVALVLMILFTCFSVRAKLIEKFCLAQHIVYVLPIKNIILNHTFERSLRQLIQK